MGEGGEGGGRGARTLGARRDRALRGVRSVESDLVPAVGGAAAPPQDLLPDEWQRDLAECLLGQRAVRRREAIEVAAAAASGQAGSADAHPVFTSARTVGRTGWLLSSTRLRSFPLRTRRYWTALA